MHKEVFDVVIIGGGPAGLSIAELCRLIPAAGFKNLLLEAGYCLEDLLFDSIRDLFGFEPAKETDDGFDFDVAECPNS